MNKKQSSHTLATDEKARPRDARQPDHGWVRDDGTLVGLCCEVLNKTTKTPPDLLREP